MQYEKKKSELEKNIKYTTKL